MKRFITNFKVIVSIFLTTFAFNLNAQVVQTFTTSGSWTCPSGVTSVQVECWGGGAAGGGANRKQTGGGGGGGGAFNMNTSITVVPGNVYTITVGAGGVGSTGNGGNGGTSLFGSSITANGGVGGAAAASANSSAAGGAGGVGGVGGTLSYNGGDGATGLFTSSTNYYSGGGGGGASTTANGSNAAGTTGGNGGTVGGGNGGNGFNTSPQNGTPGASIGAGGSGGTRDNNNGTQRSGGNGADGQVRITYTAPPCSLFTAQPTSLVLIPAVSNITGSFIASASANGYLVVMTTTASAPSSPVNGTTYTAGTAALGGTIISAASANTFNATGLAPTTQYWFWVFSYRAPTACTGTITYNSVSPLNNNATTLACGVPVNTATITTFSASINWSALPWSLGHVPIPCESALIIIDRSAATSNENMVINLDVNFEVNNLTFRNISNTSNRIVINTGGTVNAIINGNMTMECPGGASGNSFNRCVFSNVGNTTIYGNLTLGRAGFLTTATEGHSAIGSTGSTPGQTYTLYGNMTFNPRGYTTDEWAVFAFNKAGTQYIYNNTRPLTTDTIQPVLFEDLRIGTTNATTLIMQGTMFDGYIELVGRAGITIGANSVLDLPANYSLNVISGGSTSLLKMLPNSKLRLGGDRSINDVFGGTHGVAGSNFPNGFIYNLDATSTIEYYGNTSLTQTIYAPVPYTKLLATNSVKSDLVAPVFPIGSAHAQKITTAPITTANSFNINEYADVTLGTLGSSAETVNSAGVLNINTYGGLYCNANVVSGTANFTMNNSSTLGMGHPEGISPLGNATGNIQTTGARNYNNTGNYIYNGIVAQITGTGLPAAAVNDLVIDNPTTVTIANNQLVNGLHHLKQGVFDIQSNKITANGLSTIAAVIGKMNAQLGTLEMKGTTGVEQNLSGNWFVNKTINILTNANTKGIRVAVVPADTLLIAYALDYGNTTTGSTTITNDNLTLLSRLDKTANFGNATGNAILGKVNIERYMFARSAWRLLATPIQIGTSPTVSQAWRESNAAHTATGYGTRITGPTGPHGAAGILDDYSIRSSMKSYNSATNNFTDVTNCNTAAIANNKGYYVFVRGDRGAPAVLGLSGITNLRIKGDIRTGNQVFAVPATKFESVGNPYPSRIDMRSVTKTNIVNTYFTWNPNLAGLYNVGGYETYLYKPLTGNYERVGDNFVRNYIESGEAVFVQSNVATAGSLTIRETDKGNGSSNVSRPGVGEPSLEISIYSQNPDGSNYLADGILMNFDNNFSYDIDNNDVRKIANTYDNIALRNDNTSLIVERRPNIVAADTFKLYISGMRLATYRLEIDPSILNYPNLAPIFIDKYLNTQTDLSFTSVTTINFSITADVASKATDRFMIVFRAINPTSFTSIAANRNPNKSVTVKWNTQNEIGLLNYVVEKSNDGTFFTSIATHSAIANNGTNQNYTFVDLNSGVNKVWYRVKAITATSGDKFTPIAMVNELIESSTSNTTAIATLSIYPNPVTDGILKINFANQTFGKYNVVITNNLGQAIEKEVVNIQSLSSMVKLNVSTAKAGIYYAQVTNENGFTATLQFFIK